MLEITAIECCEALGKLLDVRFGTVYRVPDCLEFHVVSFSGSQHSMCLLFCGPGVLWGMMSFTNALQRLADRTFDLEVQSLKLLLRNPRPDSASPYTLKP